MSDLIPCPLCDWTIERPEPQFAPAVAAALGVPTDALASIHQHQNMRRVENDLEHHLSSHKLPEWVAALTQARAERDAQPDLVVVSHHDIEKHAEHFNEGYEAASTQTGAEALRDAATEQRRMSADARTNNGQAEHEDFADWLEERADRLVGVVEGGEQDDVDDLGLVTGDERQVLGTCLPEARPMPTRDQLMEAMRTAPLPTRCHCERQCIETMTHREHLADAVLALLNGAGQ